MSKSNCSKIAPLFEIQHDNIVSEDFGTMNGQWVPATVIAPATNAP